MKNMLDYLDLPDMEKLKYVMAIKDAYENGTYSLLEARSKLKERVSSLKPHELAFIEQQFKEPDEDECRKENIQKMMELYDGILDTEQKELPASHPISCYLRENEAMRKLLLSVEDLVQYPLIKNQWLALYEQLLTYRIHLARKQNQLYSVLEQKGFDRPTTTMWTLDDFIRDEINDAYRLLQENKDEEFLSLQETLVADVRDLMDKEDTILYPTALAMLTEEEFEEMKSGDLEIGFSLIDPPSECGQKTKPSGHSSLPDSFGSELAALLARYGYGHAADEKLKVAEGSLSLAQINLIYQHLPVDLSFVDEKELVCFYSDTKHRVFPRSKNVIGRDVKNCHPRRSVHIVSEIIEKFRSGEQNEAEFWINKPDLFIYIKYVAVRDEQGVFKGVLEMMQDCTHIRSLEGSRTLLTWDDENSPDSRKQEAPSSDAPSASLPYSEINADTPLEQLLLAKPELKEELIRISDAFRVLNTPLARVMIPKATLGKMSERSGVALDELLSRVQAFMRA